jgi:CelD/BcsL family acetyltransferase involved in cellulose biosynthesis
MPLEIRVIQSYPEFEGMEAQWNGLLEQSTHDRVFLTHEWFCSWWRAFGEGNELFIVTVRDGGEVVGIAPLMIARRKHRGLPVRSVLFMSSDDSPGCAFITKRGKEEAIKAIKCFLLRDLKQWDIMFLKNAISDREVEETLTGTIEGERKKYIARPGLRSPYLKTEGGYETYYRSLTPKSRKVLRNVSNRMRGMGKIEIKENNCAQALQDVISVSKKGWKYREGKAFINQEERRSFFEILSEVAERKEWLSIWLLYRDGEPIAYEYHLRYKKSDTALLSEYNDKYGEYSPGTYLDSQIIMRLFSNGTSVYDMCGSEERYKKKWTDEIRQYKNFIVFNETGYSGALYFVENKLVSLLKAMRDMMRMTIGNGAVRS